MAISPAAWLTSVMPGFTAACETWNLAVRHEPAVAVLAEIESDVVAGVRHAHSEGLGVGVVNTGHGTARGCMGGVLIRTDRMGGVEVDAAARTATVRAGARLQDVLDACAPHGLAPLSGFYSTVGAVGYTLGGGVGWLARRHGACSDSVSAARVVLADGRVALAGERQDADLLEAVRGGGGNFGVVTELTLDLVELDEVFAGGVYFPIDEAADLFARFAEWTRGACTDVTGAVILARFPVLDELPEPLRGRDVVGFRACHLGGAAAAADDLAAFRSRPGALLDSFAPTPFRRIGEVSVEASHAAPRDSFGALLDAVPGPDVVAELIDPGAPFVGMEVRHLGDGARPETSRGLGLWGGRYGLFSVAPASADAHRFYRRLDERLAPTAAASHTLNFLGTTNADGVVRRCYGDAHYDRLRELKARYDPANTFRFNHNIPPPNGAVDARS